MLHIKLLLSVILFSAYITEAKDLAKGSLINNKITKRDTSN